MQINYEQERKIKHDTKGEGSGYAEPGKDVPQGSNFKVQTSKIKSFL
jgi:hypothetical protein